MNKVILKWVRDQVTKTLNSIAFMPAITAFLFLLLSWLMFTFDYSETGKALKSQLSWLHLKDASTARSIISTVAAGIISLTVFSFSMVMIVLNQAASQLSNRVLDKLIGNRFQQVVLGFYIGTIVYALFLLSTIRDIDSGIYVPAISTYLLILFTIFDIFLFIYFLHYITQSVKYETIIARIHDQTKHSLRQGCLLRNEPPAPDLPPGGIAVKAPVSGTYQGFDQKMLLQVCEQEDLIIYFIYPTETFILKNAPLFIVYSPKPVTDDLLEKLHVGININATALISKDYFYGFRQLTEVALRALSPGINDPGTAIISLNALADLLAFRAQHFPDPNACDARGTVRIITKVRSFEDTFSTCILPIWDYGQNDRLLQQALDQMLRQLQVYTNAPIVNRLAASLRQVVKSKKV